MDWIDAVGYAILDVEKLGRAGSDQYLAALRDLQDWLDANIDAWDGERRKQLGARYKVGDRFANPPGTYSDYKFTVIDVAFAPHYGEWIYTCEFDHGTIDDFGEEDLQCNMQIHD